MKIPGTSIVGNRRKTPLRRRYFPMGYPLELITNSSEVIAAAHNLWDEFTPLSHVHPVTLRIDVAETDALLAPVPVMPCHFQHLMAIVQGAENFAIADMAAGFGTIAITSDVALNAPWFTYHFLEPVAYVLLGARHFTILHAASVALNGKAALLCGPSGAGKTCLSYACAKRGWRFVSGDASHMVRNSPEATVVGRPYSIRFRASARSIFSDLRRFDAKLRPSGKRDLELDTRELAVETALTAEAAILVFLNRVVDFAGADLDSMPRNAARESLNDSICFGDEKTRADQRRTLERLLDLPLLRLTYADPFEAEPLLRSAIFGGG